MTLLVVCSSLDLRAPLSATPAWWQLLKGLYEVGADLIVTAYHGDPPETPWWRAYPNPLLRSGRAFERARNVARKARGATSAADAERAGEEGWSDRLVRETAQRIVAPAWTRHLASILERHHDIDAVLFLSVPPNHLRGVARTVTERYSRPVVFYDGDAPASLPTQGGFATGFRIYDGADLGEFAAVVSNSEGSEADLAALGARNVHTVHYAADPGIYLPLDLPADIDVFFYGHTSEYRRAWLAQMIGEPSLALPSARFAVRGRDLDHTGRAESLPYLSFSRLREYVARSRVNLVITRQAHASVQASSTMRPFELAMMGACMVANPVAGIERWFEPGREIVVVHSAEEAIDRYRYLLGHDAERHAIGARARARALAEHTWVRRAGELLSILRRYA